jgi:GAF domain-containing protein
MNPRESPDVERLVRDPARLSALRHSGLLDTPPEEGFDHLTRRAARALSVPIALVTLVDAERQFLKSCVGIPEPWASRRQTPLSYSFCKHALASPQPLIIADARCHPLVRDNRAVAEMGVIAYAGAPLVTADGHVLGTLCAIDTKPRAWTPAEVETLRAIAAEVTAAIAQRTRAGG